MRRAFTLCTVLLCLASFQINVAFGYEVLTPTLINGVPVDPGTWQEVVRIISNGSACTATIVGPRAILTAAHCAKTGDTATFKYKGDSYSARIYRSPIWPGKDQDVSIGVVSSDIKGATPHKIGGTAALKTELTLLGYGCINSPGTGGNDGILRIGSNVIIGFSSYDMVSRSAGGAALCFGDSGGPAFVKNGSDYLLLGVNSKGNIKDTNYNSRLDLPETIAFLKDASARNGDAIICGVTDSCSTTPPPADPSCTLTANPSSVPLGGSISLVLAAQNAISADIDGTTVNVPSGEKRVTPNSPGNFSALATVRNSAGKSATCGANYAVTNTPPPGDKPSCTLTAVPGTAKVGETVTLEMSAAGSNLDFASIDGNSVAFPVGKLNVTRATKGDYSATGFVRGALGSVNCFANYRIEDGTPPPQVPEFAIAPTHCGSNAFENGIQSACLAVVKTDSSWTTAISQVVLVNNTDKTQEALPILARNMVPLTPGATQGTESLVTYGGKFLKGSTDVLETRPLKITKLLAGDVPLSMEGNSPKFGRLYYINPLSPFNVRAHLPDRKGTL